MRAAFPLMVTFTVLGGCTFGALNDYQLESCDPRKTPQVNDDCNRLDQGVTGCVLYQCDAASQRCLPKTRDDDRDGDPALSCGGGDCDDQDPNISSLGVGAPIDLANLVLPGDPARYAISSDGGEKPLIVFANAIAGGDCLTVAPADVASSSELTSCALLGATPTLLPTQPSARHVGDSGYSASFVSVSGCAAGALGFAYDQQVVIGECDAGVARPNLAMIDSNRALIAYYRANAATRASTLDDCPAVEAAPLELVLVGSVAAPTFAPLPVLSLVTKSMQPPAMATRDGLTFIASPTDDAATVWVFDRTSQSVVAWASLPPLTHARSASLAVETRDDGSYRLGVLSELGCDHQSLQLALVDYEPKTRRFTAINTVEASPPGTAFQWAPTIAWVPARTRWLAAWLSAGQTPEARFFDESAAFGSPSFQAAKQALTSTATSSGHVAFVAALADHTTLADAPLKCP